MSIICLICKDKLLNNAPGSPIGSLNSLTENQVITTGCGHLYHAECLQCWFRTLKKKLENQGVATGVIPDHCPTCQSEVRDEQVRRIYLLEDHREALEKAKFLERMENLEIYCHQLEINIQQLQRENDILLNKALAPSKSSLGKDEFAAIVKNDRVMWLKKDGSPLPGVVLSIFKKDQSLWVKLKLDKKIRPNQRSGLFGSFRFDKKQEYTVPFEEIILERDFKKNNIIHENKAISEPTTPTIFLPLQKAPSFRNSTMSLPGEYLGQNYAAMRASRSPGLQPILSYDFINKFGSHMELSPLVAENMANNYMITGTNGAFTNVAPMEMPNSFRTIATEEQRLNEDQQEYAANDTDISPVQNNSSNKMENDGNVSPQDGNRKHVTFADDVSKEDIAASAYPKAHHFRDHGYKNVSEMGMQGELQLQQENEDSEINPTSITSPEQIISDSDDKKDTTNPAFSEPETPVGTTPDEVPSINLIEPSMSTTPCSSSLSIPGDMQMDVFIDSQPQSPNGPEKSFNSSCFDITFMTLFYQCDSFDRVLLHRNASNDEIQQSVQQILGNEFVHPLRSSNTQQYIVGYSDRLFDTIAHLCSSYLDLEELMTILFEYVYKIPPFINYSYDMCDYIHQFFIDFTDKAKRPSVQQLFEQSLILQDNLKLCREPSPALFLQMPNSEDGIIHYDAVLPTLTLKIEHLVDKGEDAVKLETLTCYCNKTATLECAKCAKKHGKSPVLFCEDCSVLLEAIHDQMYHKLELSPIKQPSLPSISLELAAVICLKAESYSVFLRNTSSDKDYHTKWIFVEDFEEGKPKINHLPEMEEWLESILSDESSLNIPQLNELQRRLLTECRMFLYSPSHNSYA